MWRTRVGYAGGTTSAPTYRSIGDHTECFEVDFDPGTVSYDELLQLFWSSHDPTHPSYSKQYASLILTRGDEQLRLAEASRDRLESVLRRPVLTRIEPLERFYRAEDYHQKYRLRGDRVLNSEMRGVYAIDEEFTDSSVAARLNGFAGGAGTCGLLDKEVVAYGLSNLAQTHLKSLCRG